MFTIINAYLIGVIISYIIFSSILKQKPKKERLIMSFLWIFVLFITLYYFVKEMKDK